MHLYTFIIPLLIVTICYIWRQRREIYRLKHRDVRLEDLIKQMYKQKIPYIDINMAKDLWDLNEEACLELLQIAHRYGWLELTGHGKTQYRLTDAGKKLAIHLIRAHRLYEKYLAEKTGYSAEEWHEKAETKEHELSTAYLEWLQKNLSNPLYDPHGAPIPHPEDEAEKVLQHRAKVEENKDNRLTLWDLREDEEAEITALGYQLAGERRKRLLDLGFIRGSIIKTYLLSPDGSGKAYLVKDTAIALREDQARYIYIKKIS